MMSRTLTATHKAVATMLIELMTLIAMMHSDAAYSAGCEQGDMHAAASSMLMMSMMIIAK